MSDIRVEDVGDTDVDAPSVAPPRALVHTTDAGLVIDLRDRTAPRRAPSAPLAPLPEFPATERLRPGHLPHIRAFTAAFDDYSDFNATSLWGWSGSVERGYRVARCNGNLVVEFAEYLTDERFLSFLGDRHPDDTADTLLRHAAGRDDLADELRLVPAVAAAKLDPGRFAVEADDDAADYVYRASEGAQMPGQRYRSLRWTHRTWEKRWGSRAELRWVDRHELVALRDEILELMRDWGERGTDGSAHSEQELRAMRNLLDTSATWGDGLDGWSGVCLTDGELSGVFITEREDAHRLSGHFLKMTNRPPGDGFHGWYFVELCRRATEAGIVELNLQQDLGIPGLRAAKQHLRPHRKLEKFTVRRSR